MSKCVRCEQYRRMQRDVQGIPIKTPPSSDVAEKARDYGCEPIRRGDEWITACELPSGYFSRRTAAAMQANAKTLREAFETGQKGQKS